MPQEVPESMQQHKYFRNFELHTFRHGSSFKILVMFVKVTKKAYEIGLKCTYK